MINNKDKDAESRVAQSLASMMKMLDDIYKNKSSDEYKMAGDITKSPVYEGLEMAVANLKTLKGFPPKEAAEYSRMFSNLHKPIYKTSVASFLKGADEKNTAFTAIFTAGYRILVGEFSRIYSSTEATPTGIVYRPDKNPNANAATKEFIRAYNDNMENTINNAIRMKANAPKLHQEAATTAAILGTISAAATALAMFSRAHALAPVLNFWDGLFKRIFGSKKDLNPVSRIQHAFTNSYDKKVKQFENAEKMYLATKEAYEEYKNKNGPRDMRVEKNYLANIEKYNIQMKNLKAKIDHFDARAEEEAKEKEFKLKLPKFGHKSTSSSSDTSSPAPSPKPTPSGGGDDDLDF